MNWMDLLKSLIFWGPGAVLALAMIWALYKLADKHGGAFIAAQQAQATALTAQAQSMEGLKTSMQAFVAKDNGEHREMLLLLKYLAQDKQEMDELRQDHENMKKAHAHSREGDGIKGKCEVMACLEP